MNEESAGIYDIVILWNRIRYADSVKPGEQK